MKIKLLLSVLFLFLSINSFGQENNFPEPRMDSTPPSPPPPGLVVSIDKNAHFLAAAGIFLGIFLIKKKNK